jgi:hypothetical protein
VWLLTPLAGALTIGLMVVFGHPLGEVIFPKAPLSEFWPSARVYAQPKPFEQARYLLTLLGAILVPAALLWGEHRGWQRWSPRGLPVLARGAELAFVVVLALGILCRRDVVAFGISYFSVPTLIVAGVVAAGLALGVGAPTIRVRGSALLRERSTAVRWAALAIAVLAVVIWLLPAIETDSTVAGSNTGTWFDLQFSFDEGLSVLNGHTPLVNYVAQYGSLWPYVAAIPLHFTNGSLAGYTVSMTTVSALSMLAIYGVLRRVTRSAPAALLLFLTFVATSCFIARGTPIYRYSFADYFGAFPMRYAGPYFTCYLLARHLSGERPRRTVWIFLAAGLSVLNNGDFGVPCLGATILALAVCAPRPWALGGAALRVGEAIGGLLGAYALVAVVTVARTGDLPKIGLVFQYAHLFAISGYQMVRTPWFGTWIVLYLTYAAALVVGVWLMRRTADRVGAGMLVWIGIFGLGGGAYYAGRSISEVLIELFSAWALAIALLMAITIRHLVRTVTRPGIAQVALFFGFGLSLCSLAQFPAPWSSLRRLTSPDSVQLFQPTAEVDFVRGHVRRGQPVALLTYLGQRTSREAHVDDVTPFSGLLSMPTMPQLAQTISQLRAAGGHQIVLYVGNDYWPEMLPAIEHDGFRLVAVNAPPTTPDRYLLLTDAPRRAAGSARAR